MVIVTFASPTADEDGMLPSQENPYGQYSYVDNAPTFSTNKRTSNSPRYEQFSSCFLPFEPGHIIKSLYQGS
jgi:hypothetical protein